MKISAVLSTNRQSISVRTVLLTWTSGTVHHGKKCV